MIGFPMLRVRRRMASMKFQRRIQPSDDPVINWKGLWGLKVAQVMASGAAGPWAVLGKSGLGWLSVDTT